MGVFDWEDEIRAAAVEFDGREVLVEDGEVVGRGWLSCLWELILHPQSKATGVEVGFEVRWRIGAGRGGGDGGLDLDLVGGRSVYVADALVAGWVLRLT